VTPVPLMGELSFIDNRVFLKILKTSFKEDEIPL
jgi:hypothetical protein